SNEQSVRECLGGFPKIGGAITSPPYATALPYIDTQRLSLIWLGLCQPIQIKHLEEDLIGSREYNANHKTVWNERMTRNLDEVPQEVYSFCVYLQEKLGPEDGFRRKALPSLLYRYFARMRYSFLVLNKYFKKDAPYALIVGSSHTVLNGQKIAIDTPNMLKILSENVGWRCEDFLELDTYKRFDLHQKNSIKTEKLIVLRRK
ncbi:MAG TPA: RNA methylase, partial [Candidatus Dojkabacteria bacterium]|nr:RNA methylase [Candidatus Dojkabacteria bacterium]